MQSDKRYAMNDPVLLEIACRCGAATKLPWWANPEGPSDSHTSTIVVGHKPGKPTAGDHIEIPGGPGEDLHFIVAARSDIPRLLSQFKEISMTKSELMEITERYKSASTNPWAIHIPDPAHPDEGEVLYAITPGVGHPIDLFIGDARASDLEFIEHARNDVAVLIEKVGQLLEAKPG